ncbi:acyl-CoA dehydrogenase family protein [Amycolatopsis taiwanensis]|uniref:NrtC protein n=1 Tax=Amycolatopsis taiwanensis TaxID=342230 RepID=A0A9W6RBX4_9PSEU|nr:acyl-CoA dehydrogenase family protein [Amycolatopsis taiwanensis]GLY71125.1 nrtC protein [Amycolatopsis taiwanensis]
MTVRLAGEDTAVRVREFFAARAAETDSVDGDVRPGLRLLGELGVLGLGAGADGGDPLGETIEVIAEVAGECLSSAFSLWAHRMVLEYLARGRATALTATIEPALHEGVLVGSTAMATALRDIAGIAPVPVVAEPVRGGLRLTGPIPWASNLFPGAVIVLPARLPDDRRAVVFVRLDDPGVETAAAPKLLALNGTGSSSVRLHGVEVPDEAVLSTDLPAFVAAFRPTFLLAQTAFCVGLAARSLTEAEQRIKGTNTELATDLAEQSALLDDLRARSRTFAQDTRRHAVREFIRLRLDGARLAVAATRLEATVAGGGGYVAASGTSRRLREAAFLPIQSPTEGQLRWELRHFA